MYVKKAKSYFLGQDGCSRVSCAAAILSAFKEKLQIDDDEINNFKSYGGGRAPDGLCGAYYAAKSISNKLNNDQLDKLEKDFFGFAGALKCSEIRTLKKKSCIQCVGKCAEFLQNRFTNS